ncbi:hypothetical protein SLEP1_g56528 [Rubroshorea leprosula]|uniref:Uncharacterized protein n=1 Tax=Rubroshorea leprosula TaxID=152421 RepID=A0AAV5MJZ0_9ROSI|nr:hypothetical protein SLEP1_g56528 [Rubroshorea leprosula]
MISFSPAIPFLSKNLPSSNFTPPLFKSDPLFRQNLSSQAFLLILLSSQNFSN